MPQSSFPPGLPLVVRPRSRVVPVSAVDIRIFLSVLAALAAFGLLVLVVLFVAFRVHRAHQRAVMQSLVDYAQQSLRAGQQQAAAEAQQRDLAARRTAEARMLQVEHRTLVANERCMGGMVVRQVGSIYTQLGAPGDPVRCQGRLADRPIH